MLLFIKDLIKSSTRITNKQVETKFGILFYSIKHLVIVSFSKSKLNLIASCLIQIQL